MSTTTRRDGPVAMATPWRPGPQNVVDLVGVGRGPVLPTGVPIPAVGVRAVTLDGRWDGIAGRFEFGAKGKDVPTPGRVPKRCVDHAGHGLDRSPAWSDEAWESQGSAHGWTRVWAVA